MTSENRRNEMTREKLGEILEKHRLWLQGVPGGQKADLRDADLRDADLRGADLRGASLSNASLSNANLSWANLIWADLSGANLRGADLCKADLSKADLSNADLSNANLSWANLSNAVLCDADLRKADLRGADLRGASLRGASLSNANLSNADLSWANLSNANLCDANLNGANLRKADLSGAKGLPRAVDYMETHFKRTDAGYVAYKTFSQYFVAPDTWEIAPGNILAENVNFDRCTECGCGINVAPLEWVRRNNGGNLEIWKVLIRWEWLCGVCVPYNTDGKIRCERVELLEVV